MTRNPMSKKEFLQELRTIRGDIANATALVFGRAPKRSVEAAVGDLGQAHRRLGDLLQELDPQYTVVGLRDSLGELTVAGVFPGSHDAADSDPGGEFQRWASSYQVDDPSDAEALARQECGGDDG